MSSEKRPSILIGLIGAGIGKSLTPPMHEREGDMQGMRYIYKSVDMTEQKLGVEDLPDLLLAAQRMGFTGLNITHPCKQAVVALLDDLSETAARVGAVNTVVFSDGRCIGHNTDEWGFYESFRREIAADCLYDKILLLGVGGAGTAVAHALLGRTECCIEIYDTNEANADAVAKRLVELYGEGRAIVSDNIANSIGHSDGVINATPVGMASHPGSALDIGLLRPNLWVVDVVYFPMRTELINAAMRAGCTVMQGGGMAVYQAVRAFEIFTGVKPDAERMKAHFRSLLPPATIIEKNAEVAAIPQ